LVCLKNTVFGVELHLNNVDESDVMNRIRVKQAL